MEEGKDGRREGWKDGRGTGWGYLVSCENVPQCLLAEIVVNFFHLIRVCKEPFCPRCIFYMPIEFLEHIVYPLL